MAKPGLRKIYRYSDEFKTTAVRLSQLPGVAVKDVAASLDIHPFMLSRWRKEHREAPRVVKRTEIDPKTQAIVWKYEGGTDPKDQFEAEKGGAVQKLPNGNVLITHSWQGRVLEVTGDAEPRIVWEYVNLLEAGEGGGKTGVVIDVKRFLPGELTFLDAPGS